MHTPIIADAKVPGAQTAIGCDPLGCRFPQLCNHGHLLSCEMTSWRLMTVAWIAPNSTHKLPRGNSVSI